MDGPDSGCDRKFHHFDWEFHGAVGRTKFCCASYDVNAGNQAKFQRIAANQRHDRASPFEAIQEVPADLRELARIGSDPWQKGEG